MILMRSSRCLFRKIRSSTSGRVIPASLTIFLQDSTQMKEIIKKILFANMSYNQITWFQERWMFWKSISSVQYRGDRFYCPFCDGNFKEFFPAGKNNPVLESVVGARYRKNARCPRCSSLDRHRLLWYFLKREILPSINRKIKLLHIAPELHLKKLLCESNNIEYLSADINPKAGMIKMDITAINYYDNYFDAIVCNHVFEHILDDKKAMKEIYRILHPNGWAILQVPLDVKREKTFEDANIRTMQDRERIYGIKSHVRIYGLDYKKRLEESGFNVKQVKYSKQLDKSLIDKLSIEPEEDIFLCMK